jgi:very-short-patch-repair endonuclease
MNQSLLDRSKLARKRAAELRKNRTVHEQLVQLLLDDLHIKYKFQYPIFNEWYFLIADFYIPRYKLLIEVDGNQHKEYKKYAQEEKRKVWLTGMGYKILRIDNIDVFKLKKKDLLSLIKNA